jgi:DNA replication and repair protein RecF
MRLLRLQTANFRNLVSGVLEVDAPIVAFCGANGQGKTNWLEAIGVLGTLRSFRTGKPAEMLKQGEREAGVEGFVHSDGMGRRFAWSWAGGARTLRREDRAIDAVSWLRAFRAAYFVPSDVAPIRGEPALRRAMLDRAALTADPGYLSLAQQFRRAMEQKAALLRSGAADGPTLDAVDAQLAGLSVRVIARRTETVAGMLPSFQHFHEAFAGGGAQPAHNVAGSSGASPGDSASVRYRPNVTGDAEGLFRRFQAARPDERAMRRPLVGPHRDDLEFSLGGRPARGWASQGQARSLILAWKLAELDCARRQGETPLFLVDDVGSELDPERTARLVRLLGTLGAQVFLTTTDARYLPDGVEGMQIVRVEGGAARPA